MKARAPLIDDDGEVRELTAEDMKHFRPAAEVLPPDLYADLLAMNQAAWQRTKESAPKEHISIRLSPDVLRRFRATGKGWQTRMDAALREWLDTHIPAN